MQNLEAVSEPSTIFFGQIDSYSATKDYQRQGRCVRILAVEEEAYSTASLNHADGVSIISIELSYWEFCRSELGNNCRLTQKARELIDLRDEYSTKNQKWYRLEVQWNGAKKDGYAFKTFSDEAPRYFQLISCKSAAQNIKPSPPPRYPLSQLVLKPGPSANSPSDWVLSAFHVGQGMCSLITNGESGVLLDLGAGTPITRPRYLRETGFSNELRMAIKPLKNLDLVLSHADQDHWRILAWDSEIRKKIATIFVPEGAKPLAFKDPSIVKKIVEIGDLDICFSDRSHLDIFRSAPGSSDDNSECLVCVFASNNKRALIAGDYVYERFLTDKHPRIKNLHNLDFDAVVVPHHGDAASAKKIVKARSDGVAFFSAGDHKRYKHPTVESRDQHREALFREICDNTYRFVKRVQLI